MNQINQGNELHIIPFLFIFLLSGYLLLLDYFCYYYTLEGKITSMLEIKSYWNV